MCEALSANWWCSLPWLVPPHIPRFGPQPVVVCLPRSSLADPPPAGPPQAYAPATETILSIFNCRQINGKPKAHNRPLQCAQPSRCDDQWS